MNPNIRIRALKTFVEVETHLATVQSFADRNKSALGFLPRSTFHDQALRGRLWISVNEETDEFLGYLLFGGRFPSIKIFQLFVSPENQRQGIGSNLVNQLVEFGELNGYLTISARVAADLPANRFWESTGLHLVRQESGGKALGRKINVRVRDLETPSLLKMMDHIQTIPSTKIQDLYFRPGPISRSSIYVLDLNVFFDVVRDRVHRKEASLLIQAGLNHQIRVRVTPEFTKELRRHTKAGRPDPILEFAKEIPTLPRIEPAEFDHLLLDLQVLIFPLRSPTSKHVRKVQSDLVHIAYCIRHGISGFVTREKAILAASDRLEQAYSLEILSPADFFPGSELPVTPVAEIRASYGEKSVTVATTLEREREEVERFLISMGVDLNVLPAMWDPGASGSVRRRITIRIGERLIGVASWDAASRFKRNINLHLYVDEQNPAAERVIDHVLETVLRDSKPFEYRRILLQTTPEQTLTCATALQRGFVESFPHVNNDHMTGLTKFSYRGVITKDNWSPFANDFGKLTGLRLPQTIPTLDEFRNTGVTIMTSEGKRQLCILRLFDFETLISPALVLSPGRTGLIVPIRVRFAKDLFEKIHYQTDLFPAREAILHVEKAYFRYPRKVKLFDSGVPILFYLSGSGGGTQEIIGCARITYSKVLPVHEVDLSLRRQGVLSYEELLKISDNSENIHAFTFDNFNLFPKRIPLWFLRDNKLISKANLVTVEPLSAGHILRICNCGFGLEEIR